MRRRVEADAMRVPGLYALLQSEGSGLNARNQQFLAGEPVEISPVELTLASVEVPPFVMWVSDRAFERCDRLRVYPDDTITVIERDPPVRRPVWPDDEEEW